METSGQIANPLFRAEMENRMNRRSVWISLSLMLAIGAIGVLPVSAGPPKPATPDEIKSMIAQAGDTDKYSGADIVYVLDEADVYVQDSGLATTESCQVIKILTDAGIRSQCIQRFDFDPATRRVTVRSARIHRADGVIEEIPLTSLVTQPTVQQAIYWGGDQHLLTIPGLEIGDALEVRVSKIGFNIAYLENSGDGASAGGATTSGGAEETLQPPMPGHWYEVTLFQGAHPILHKRYTVHMPSDKPVQFEVYNGALKSSLWFDDDRHVYTWTANDIPAVKREPHMEALDDCVPKVVMATVADWESKSRWFYDVNESQFDADDAIRAKVAEITEGLTDIEDKIAACNHWVADNIRYYGTSRGPCEGFTLHASTETFRDRGGVCKDKAGMLVTMLRVLGVETYAALTMAGSRVEALPADQFNHTVTVMKDQDGEFRILDPTWIPLSREMWSSREALQGLVYGTKEGESLTLSPYYPPDYNRLIVRSMSRINETGGLATRINMEMSGYPDTYLRRGVARYAEPDVLGAFEHVINIAPTARIREFEYTDPYDYSDDAKVRLTIMAENYAAGDESIRMFRLPLMKHPLADWLIPDLFNSFDKKDRDFDYRMRATRLVRYEETIKLPDGWVVEQLPDPREVDSPSATLKFEASRNGAELTYSFEFALKNHTIPAEDYTQVKEAIDTMKKLTDDWIVCRVGEERSAASHAAGTTSNNEVAHD
jgi:hypothetical protein